MVDLRIRSARIHVVVGSKSDVKDVKASGLLDILCEVVGYDDIMLSTCSAHRNPEELAEYVEKACASGAKVFIGVAGLAAALPGALAGDSGMTKPVIGVPRDQYGVYSCIAMPPGVPVLTAGLAVIEGAYAGLINAAIAACQVLATGDMRVEIALAHYLKRTAKEAEFDISIVDLVTLKVLAEGKTKQILEVPGAEDVVFVRSKDDITAGDGARHDQFEGKAVAATATTCNVFKFLEQHGIPTHFLGEVDPRTFRANRCDMVPVEVVMRRRGFGSYLKRHPDVLSGTRFDEVVVEFFHKDDANHDPLLIVNDDGTVSRVMASVPFGSFDGSLGLLNDVWSGGDVGDFLFRNHARLGLIGRKVFELLEAAWAKLGHSLVDLKIEFGCDAVTGTLLVADVIDNDSWRVWLDGDPKQQVDKQVYRDHGLDEPAMAMQIKGNYDLVAALTGQF